METKDKLYYYHNDINGAPLRLTDEAGNVVWNVHYNIFGKIDKLKINEVHNPIRMQGQYEDEETGLYYNRYRYYDPNISAYVSQDPIRLRAGINLYSYGLNSFGWIDPMGLSCSTDSKKLGENLGDAPGKDHNAHHIVMSNSQDSRMVSLREQMAGFKNKDGTPNPIDINSEENGIWLPKNEAARIDDRTLHYGEGVHGDDYKQKVFDELNGKPRSEFMEGLDNFKEKLMNGDTFLKK